MTGDGSPEAAVSPRRLAVVGAGKAAASLARALLERGYTLAALTARTRASAQAASLHLGDAPIAASNAACATAGEIVIVGVPDADIAAVASEIAGVLAPAAGTPPPLAGRVVFHLSGALEASELLPLRPLGAALGSLHPLQTFPERVEERAYLAGVAFGVEGDAAAVDAAAAIVAALDGRLLRLLPGTKGSYHAAASIVSNHTTALLDLALRLMARAGIAHEEAMTALLPLLLATLGAVEERGTRRALTGPIVRGDADTVARHLALLDGPDRALYAALARATADLAVRSERLAGERARRIESVLAERPVGVVCSLAAATAEGLCARSDEALAAGANLVEHRLDLLEEPAAAAVERLATARAIVTCRVGARVDAGTAHGLLARAAAAGAAYVDVALALDEAADPAPGLPRDRLILSWHGPAALGLRAAAAIAALRPAVAKVVIEATSPLDLLLLPEIARTLRQGSPVVVALASAPAGSASRILARRLGSDWTYAALAPGAETAPGQIALKALLETYRVRAVGAATRVFGLTGDPIAHSLSPLLMNRVLPELVRDAVYVPLPAPAIAPVLELAQRLPLDGLSVTMPLKEAAAHLVASAGAEARLTASVNTIVRRGARLHGENTDVAGIARAAGRLLPLAGARALVLGAGGSARSAALALRDRGARVTLVSRSPARARAAAERLQVAWAASPDDVPWDLVVNATPAGMGADAATSALDPARLTGTAVLDLVYDPRVTRLVAEARARGLAAAGGVEVLIEQAAEQLRLFTDRVVDPARLRLAFEEDPR